MPEDLLRAAGPASASDRLSLVMTRLRSSGTPPRSDVETALARDFWLPTARTFSLTGTARISPLIPDDMIDRLVGRSAPPGGTVTAYSLGRLPGDLRAGAVATLDGDPSTLWEPGFGASHQAGQWLQYVLPRPVTFDHLDLAIAADGRHSVPTAVTVAADGHQATVTLPPVADSRVPGSVAEVPIRFAPLTGQSIRITFDRVRDRDHHQLQLADPDRHAHRGGRGRDTRASWPGRCRRPSRAPAGTISSRWTAAPCGCRSPAPRPRRCRANRSPCPCAALTRGGCRSHPAPTPCARASDRSPASTSTSWGWTRRRAAVPCRSPRPARWRPLRPPPPPPSGS